MPTDMSEASTASTSRPLGRFLASVAARPCAVVQRALPRGNLPASLTELRARIMSHGISVVTFRSWMARGISNELGLLAANEHLLITRRCADARAHWLGASHPSHGAPAWADHAIHEGAIVERDAVIVGPALIGAHAHINARAMVVHAVVGQRSTVPAAATVRNVVWLGDPANGAPARPRSRKPRPSRTASRA